MLEDPDYDIVAGEDLNGIVLCDVKGDYKEGWKTCLRGGLLSIGSNFAEKTQRFSHSLDAERQLLFFKRMKMLNLDRRKIEKWFLGQHA